MAKSIVCLSDMFTERAHYEWMLSTFLEISKNHPQHDEIMHQYLILGVSKAAAVLNIFVSKDCSKMKSVIKRSIFKFYTNLTFVF